MSAPASRRRHLMDPANPVRQVNDQRLTHVQRWVMSVLAVTTIIHLAVGLVIAAAAIESGRQDARIGLLVIAGVFGVLAVAAGRLIHQRSPLTPWLVLGVLPAVVGAWWVLG